MTVLARIPAKRRRKRPPKTARYYAEARQKAEARLGRPLTDAEKRIDIVTIDRTLDDGKQALWKAIVKEQRRVASALVLGQSARFNVTPEMTRVIVRLHLAGQREARKELRQIGVEPRKLYAETPPPVRPILERTQSLLDPLNVKVATAVQDYQTSFGGVISAALAGRLAERVPGPLDVASRLVSTGFTSGLNDVFADNADVITRWQYSAVMDGATCDACAEHDGEEYETLDELYDVLPNFGPNPDCYGDGRCRCRGVPADAGDSVPTSTSDALDFYHSPESFDLNASLRAGAALTPVQRGVVSALDAAFTPAAEQMTLYRGVPDSKAVFGRVKPLTKTEKTWDGYTSLTADRSVAEDFSIGIASPEQHPVVMRVIVPKGTPILRVPSGPYGNQDEWLLPRGVKIRINGADDKMATADAINSGEASTPLVNVSVADAPTPASLTVERDVGITGDVAAQSLAADFSGFDATLTAEEAATLANYTLIDHVAINAALRGSAVAADQLPALARLDRVIERGLTFAPMRVYRGVGPEVKIPKVGETFIDQGYVSTSVDESVARDVFGAHGGRVLEIRVPAFSSGVYVPSTRTAIEGIHAEAVAREREFLLPRNSRFRVVKKTRAKVVLELLPPE